MICSVRRATVLTSAAIAVWYAPAYAQTDNKGALSGGPHVQDRPEPYGLPTAPSERPGEGLAGALSVEIGAQASRAGLDGSRTGVGGAGGAARWSNSKPW